jgi:pimeloyl-ACP methyl ester carboxylesterase
MKGQLAKELSQVMSLALTWPRVSKLYKTWMKQTRPQNSAGYVKAGDISIYFRRYGAGDPVLLLHGGFMYAETWAGQIPALASRYQVIAMDSRGHGRTTLGTRPLTYRQMAEDAAALIEKLDLGPINLVGLSDGGSTSLALALQRPELVRSLVLLVTPFNTDNYNDSAKRFIEGQLRPWSLSLMGFKIIRRLLTREPENGAQFFEKMKSMWTKLPDFTVEDLQHIEAPTLVVACDHDEYLSPAEDPLRVFSDTAAAIPNARMVTIPGGTHLVNVEHYKTVNSIILDFLESV